MEVQRGSLGSARMAALAAGLSVGATIGYVVYRHISSSRQEPEKEESEMILPLEVYRHISKSQATFLDVVSNQSGACVRVLSDLEKPGHKAVVCFQLQGSKEQVLLARCVLEKLITDCEPMVEVLEVPQTAFGRVIGTIIYRVDYLSLGSFEVSIEVGTSEAPSCFHWGTPTGSGLIGSCRGSMVGFTELLRAVGPSTETPGKDRNGIANLNQTCGPRPSHVNTAGVVGLQEQCMETIVVGDIVAAPYRDNNSWNRAKVLGVLGSGLVDLYYVDYGDNGELSRDRLRSLRSDFLSLPFQAIECSLAGVRPKGDVWTEAALDAFEQLTYCANWTPLQAKLCSYSHSDVSSWPNVKLYDNSKGKVLDIGEELIRLGHAVSFQDTLNDKTEGDNLGCLQRMLDDVIGASSELSLSCISLSEAASVSGSVDDGVEDDLL
uniref:Tudor and KH domain containing n=1 Tax=Cyprinodon variegatus TaxID=28743 RepID=A0A3Q2GPP4_CYPVA